MGVIDDSLGQHRQWRGNAGRRDLAELLHRRRQIHGRRLNVMNKGLRTEIVVLCGARPAPTGAPYPELAGIDAGKGAALSPPGSLTGTGRGSVGPRR